MTTLPRRNLITSLIIAAAIVAFIIILNPFVIITAGHRGVVLNWGAVQSSPLPEGIHWRTPVWQTVKLVDVRVQKEQVEVSAASKDLQSVSSIVALNFHVDPEKAPTLYQNVGNGYSDRLIAPAIQEAVKAATARYTAEELITKREDVKNSIVEALRGRLGDQHIVLDDVSIINFEFSPAFNTAIENKVKAEQDALAAKNTLEKVKFEAEQRIAQARGEAEAIKIQAEAITQQGGQSYVDLQAIAKWNGMLPSQMIPGATLPFINLTR